MPEGFAFPMNHSYWVPLRVDPSTLRARSRARRCSSSAGSHPVPRSTTRRPSSTTIGARAAAAISQTRTQRRPRVLPYTYPLVDIQGATLWEFAVMQAMVSLLLVVWSP